MAMDTVISVACNVYSCSVFTSSR